MEFNFTRLKALIYPNKCIVCQKLLPSYATDYVCEGCYTGILKHNICQRCGHSYKLGEEKCLCCTKEEHPVIRQIAGLFPYEEGYRKSILRWKYSGIRKYARGYADLLVNDLNLIERMQIDAMIPVPLAPSREKKRGFNQAYDLAKEISILTNKPVYPCLRRNRDTKPQAQCNKGEREQNIKGSIEINSQVHLPQLKKVAIVDDIYTTGSTTRECIKVLKKEYAMKDTLFYLIVVCIGG